MRIRSYELFVILLCLISISLVIVFFSDVMPI